MTARHQSERPRMHAREEYMSGTVALRRMTLPRAFLCFSLSLSANLQAGNLRAGRDRGALPPDSPRCRRCRRKAPDIAQYQPASAGNESRVGLRSNLDGPWPPPGRMCPLHGKALGVRSKHTSLGHREHPKGRIFRDFLSHKLLKPCFTQKLRHSQHDLVNASA